MGHHELPPVVLLHGLATSARRTWGETGWIDILVDEGRRCIALELPGHRGPTDSKDPESYRGFEQQVLAMFPDEPCDVIGFSLGARTAAIIAALQPDRVRRLVLAGVGANLFRSEGHNALGHRALGHRAFGHSALLAGAIEGLAGGLEPEPPELAVVAHHFAQLARSCGVDLGALVAVLRRPDAATLQAEDLASLSAATLVVLGDRDPAGPADPLIAALRTVTLVELRNTDHFATPRSLNFIQAAIEHLHQSD